MKITPVNETVVKANISLVKQDLIIAVQIFEERVRKSNLYFAWREGEKIVPEQLSGKEKKPINRLFLETQILLFVVFITLGMFLFIIVGWLTPAILMAIQFILVFYSNKIIGKSGDWRITESNPYIHLLVYHMPRKEGEENERKYSKDKLLTLKKEIYEEILVKKGEIDCDSAQKIFTKYGIECQPQNLSSKKVNVYQLVKKTADKFRFPTPEIVVSNTMIPNAAASGPSPGRGVVLITTGLLVQLEEDEVLSVLGHEFGHLKGRDPLFLFFLAGAEFLFRFYVLFPVFPFISYSLLFLIYFWAVMTTIYFIAKFFEARADLVSAIVVGQPKVLARALKKIGFKRLLSERVPSLRFQEWIGLEPHPPVYFRVDRLEKLEVPIRIKYPFVQSLKDVIKGFLKSLRT